MIPRRRADYVVSEKMTPDIWLDGTQVATTLEGRASYNSEQVWEIQCADLSISPVHTGGKGL